MANREEMLRVAKMSFVDGMNNMQIAAVLRPDKPVTQKTRLKWVQDLIDETGEWLMKREQTLHERETADTPEKELQKQLRLKFGLLDARVVPGGDVTDPAGYSALLKTYGVAAALYLDELVMAAEEHGDWLHVGFSGGQTVLDMATALIDRPRTQACFYALAMIGRGSTNATSHVSPESNCTIAWSRSGRYPNRAVYSTVPPYHVNRADLRDGQKDMLHDWVRREIDKDIMELAARDPIAETLRRIQKISVAFAGLGLIQPSDSAHNKGLSHLQKLSMTDLLEPLGVDINRIEGEGAIGELSYCPFDADGIGQQDWNYFITAGYGSEHSGVDFYRDMVRRKKPVVVMAGFHKMVALLRKPFRWRGELMVCVGTSGRGGVEQADAYRLVPVRAASGEPTTYNGKTGTADGAEAARNDPRGFYDSMRVLHGKDVFVLIGPPVKFIAKTEPERPIADHQSQQMSLFT